MNTALKIVFPAADDENAVAATLAAASSSRRVLNAFADVFLNPAQRPIPAGRVVRARRPALFRQADVTRAVKAMEKAGKEIGSARIDKDGRIVVVCLSEPASEGETNEWDTVLKK